MSANRTKDLSKPLFIAIPVPANHSDLLAQAAMEYDYLDNIRLIPPENFHVTVIYIGRTHLSNITFIKEVLNEATRKISSFRIDFQDIVLINRKGNSGMIWAQYNQSEAFQDSVHEIYYMLRSEMEIQMNHSEPIPHITLARIKKLNREQNWLPGTYKNDLSFVSQVFELMESNQTTSGVFYKSIYSKKLN